MFLCRFADLIVLATLLPGGPNAATQAEVKLPDPTEWTVEGVARKALVVPPSKAGADHVPVVFVFHGHGGNMNHSARKMPFHRHWPEALVVYMQGLPTPGKFDPDGKRAGWQKAEGDQSDRDLKFLDAVLKALCDKYKVDEKRVYATGHSNGGGFTYLLWSARPKVFAAYAPSAAGFRPRRGMTPAPVLHVAGEKDATVPFENQKRIMAVVRRINGCEAEGKEWAKGCTLYAAKDGSPFVSFVHPGDHKYPDEAPPVIVKFFKEHARKP